MWRPSDGAAAKLRWVGSGHLWCSRGVAATRWIAAVRRQLKKQPSRHSRTAASRRSRPLAPACPHQALVTRQGPIEALQSHLSSPFTNNFVGSINNLPNVIGQ